MKDRHKESLAAKINAFASDAHDRLEHISEFGEGDAAQIVVTILQYSCCAQNSTAILAGKAAFKRIPEPWLATRFPRIVDMSLDLADEWQYRRLLELLKEVRSSWLDKYIERGLKSENDEVREAATDLRA